MDTAKLVEMVSDRFSIDWDIGTPQNARLAYAISAVMVAAFSVLPSPCDRARLLAVLIEAAMNLDASDEDMSDLFDIVTSWLRGK